MQRRELGSTGVALPVIGQGTWNLDRHDRRQAVIALQRGIDLGMTHLDTAELYGMGAVEELVGEAVAGRRDEVFLVGKIIPEHASREGTIRRCEASLRRLGTDRIDCYLLHWLGPHPFEETVAALEELVAAGKILRWGVSNFDEVKLERLLRVAGEGRVACNQVLYHLNERSIEHAVIPFCQRRNVAVVGYSPFGTGRFAPSGSRGRRVLEAIARGHGASARQVALAFLARHDGSFVIPKAATLSHVEDNAAAGRLVLRSEDVAAIDEVFPRGPRRDGVPTLE